MVFAFVRKTKSIVYVGFNGTPKSEQELQPYLNGLKKIYQEHEKASKHFTLLYDARKIGKIPWKFVQKQLTFMKEFRPVTKKYVKKIAIVLAENDTWSKTILDTIFLLVPPVCDIKVIQSNSLQDASSYLNAA